MPKHTSLALRPFEGLAGILADSLPDGWGRLLFDRKLRANGIHPSAVSGLNRLTYVGLWGLGALVYGEGKNPGIAHLTKLAMEANHSKTPVKNVIDQNRTALRSTINTTLHETKTPYKK